MIQLTAELEFCKCVTVFLPIFWFAKRNLKSQIKLEKKSLSKAKDDAAVQLARDIKDVRERFSGLKQTAEVRARVKDLVTAAREKHKVQLANLEQQAKDLNNKEKELARFAPKSFDASVFERLFNTALVGQVLTATTPEIGKTLIWPAEWTHAHTGEVLKSGTK